MGSCSFPSVCNTRELVFRLPWFLRDMLLFWFIVSESVRIESESARIEIILCWLWSIDGYGVREIQNKSGLLKFCPGFRVGKKPLWVSDICNRVVISCLVIFVAVLVHIILKYRRGEKVLYWEKNLTIRMINDRAILMFDMIVGIKWWPKWLQVDHNLIIELYTHGRSNSSNSQMENNGMLIGFLLCYFCKGLFDGGGEAWKARRRDPLTSVPQRNLYLYRKQISRNRDEKKELINFLK